MFKASQALLLLILIGGPCFADELESYIPKSEVENFIGANLDLSTFRNSLGPRRTAKTRTFQSLGMSPSLAKEGNLRYDSPDWYYGVQIKGRRDYNGDGIEDLVLCFVDKAKKGTYSTVNSLLATRYSNGGSLIVLGYAIDVCGHALKFVSR